MLRFSDHESKGDVFKGRELQKTLEEINWATSTKNLIFGSSYVHLAGFIGFVQGCRPQPDAAFCHIQDSTSSPVRVIFIELLRSAVGILCK